MQVTGKAVGGPRDGIKLTAGVDWDGRVQVFTTSAPDDKRGRTYHKGRYIWSDVTSTWNWRADEKSPDARTQR